MVTSAANKSIQQRKKRKKKRQTWLRHSVMQPLGIATKDEFILLNSVLGMREKDRKKKAVDIKVS